MTDDASPEQQTLTTSNPASVRDSRRWRLTFRLGGIRQSIFQQLVDAEGLPKQSTDARERRERFSLFATLLRGCKCSLHLARCDGNDVYIPPKVCCAAAAVLVYLALLERGSCLAWVEWSRLADLRGVEYNSAYKQINAFAKILNRQCDVTEGPFEYPQGRGAVRFLLEPFDVEFCM